MIELGKKGDVTFFMHTSFKNSFLLPIGHYLNWKLKYDWDDYNELYHCHQFIEEVQSKDGVWLESHTVEKADDIIGVLLIVGGELHRLSNSIDIDPTTTVLLKYFHIIDKGNGYGTYWIKQIIIPYYRNKGLKTIFISSSHEKSFPFYERLGKEVSTFVKNSDNGRYVRKCKSFYISL